MKHLHWFASVASAAFFIAPALAQNSGTVTNHAFAIGKGPGVTGYTSLLCGSAQIAVGQAAADPICRTITGGMTLDAAGVATVNGLRPINPVNLYVSPSGNDSNPCTVVGSPCLTIQRAVNVAQGYDLQGNFIKINLAAGTYTKGATISGVAVGATNAMMQIVGAGSGFTIIDPTTNCGSGTNAIAVANSAVVGLGSLTVQTSCSGGSALSISNGGIAFLVDNGVNFGGGVLALISAISFAKFDANYSGAFKLTISGSAQFGFYLSTYGTAVTGVGVTNTILGTPGFSIAFVSAIDHSFYNEGISSSWANASNATGTRYSIALNSTIDREQNAGNLPGSTPGLIQGVSVYYQNNAGTSDLPCVGGAGGCRTATAPTGLGSGGSATMFAGSNDHSGAVALAMGTSPPAAGSVVIAPLSILTGDYGGKGFCVVSPNANAATWPTNAVVQSYYDASGIHISWSGTMSASVIYYISYVCS